MKTMKHFLCICILFVSVFTISSGKPVMNEEGVTLKEESIKMTDMKYPTTDVGVLNLFFSENQAAKKDGMFILHKRTDLCFVSKNNITTIYHQNVPINGLLNFEGEPNILVSMWLTNGIPDGFVVVYRKFPHIIPVSKGCYKNGRPFWGTFIYSLKYNKFSARKLYFENGFFKGYSILESPILAFQNVYNKDGKLLYGYELVDANPQEHLRLRRFENGQYKKDISSDEVDLGFPNWLVQRFRDDFLLTAKGQKEEHFNQWKKMSFDW